MALKLYNTLSKTKEDFIPLDGNQVRLYSCGPTVYNYAHIGNFRAFLFSDTIRRVLTYLGYEVTQVINITDVDDKIIHHVNEAGISLPDLTRKYEAIWREDLEALNILPPHHTPRATEYIQDMIKMITTLLDKRVAYTAEDGVYFNITKTKDYGRLADLKLDAVTRSRIQNDEYDKNNPQDFVLWKFWKEEDGGIVWEAPFGNGRPGWHIECSVMSTALLGETIDIHTGGIDLIFPHHTNEIAQSEATTEKTFVRYWLHSGHIHIAEEKMSKSLGNILNIRDLENSHITPLAYRYWLLTLHYRTTGNFTFETVLGTQEAYKKLVRFIQNVDRVGEIVEDYKNKFIASIEDDLNTAQALAVVWELMSDSSVSDNDKKATLLDFDRVLGLGLKNVTAEKIPTEIVSLLEQRETARQNKNWQDADTLREKIDALGYEVQDSPQGQKVYKK